MNYIRILICLLVLDILWIGLVFRPYFSGMIYNVQGSTMEIRILPAIIAYIILFVLAITILPKMDNMYQAFLLGFCVYGVYDATNYATIKNWNPVLSIVDTLWGGTLFSLLYLYAL